METGPSLIDVDAKFSAGPHRVCPLGRSTFPHSRYRHCLQDEARAQGFTPQARSAFATQKRCNLCGSLFETDWCQSLVCTGCKAVVSKSSKTYSGMVSREEGLFHGTLQDWLDSRLPTCDVCDSPVREEFFHPIAGETLCQDCGSIRLQGEGDRIRCWLKVALVDVVKKCVLKELLRTVPRFVDANPSRRDHCFDTFVVALIMRSKEQRKEELPAAIAPAFDLPPDLGILKCLHGNMVVVGESGPHYPRSEKMPCGCDPAFPGDHLIDPLFEVIRRGCRWKSQYAVLSESEIEFMFAKEEAVVPKKKRGTRGGRKAASRNKGYCYTLLVTRKHRPELSSLGKKPTLEKVVVAMEGMPITTKSKALEMRTRNGYHVVPKEFPMEEQIAWLYENKPHIRIGSDTWEEDIEADAEFMYAHVFLPMVERGEITIAEAYGDPEPIVETMGSAWQAAIIPEEPVLEEEEVPVKVGGEGWCWTQLGSVVEGYASFREDEDGPKLTVEELMDCVDGNYWYGEGCVIKFEEQDDGDLHIAGVAWGDISGIEEELPEGVCTHETVWDYLSQHKTKKRLVGKASTAPVDTAMRALNNPTVNMGLQNAAAAKVTNAITRSNTICPWPIPVSNQHHATSLCIPWSETGADIHQHPIHAAIRRIQCIEELPKHIKSDYTTISMGHDNSMMLSNGIKSKGLNFQGYHQNPVIDMKDHGRYAGDGSVPKKVFTLDEVTTPTVIFHDSGHYMTPSFLWSFFYKNPKVMFVYVTHVFPLVSLLVDTSPDPTLYEFDFSADRKTLIYIPEGHLGGKYEQPSDPGILLAKTISDKEGLMSLRGSVIDSRLNSHVQCWTRFQLATSDFVALSMPEMMPLKRVKRGMPERLPLVKTEYYTKLFQYAKTLSMKESDAWGKMRQFTVDNHMYFPVGVQAQLIDCVMEAVKIPVTPDLQSKYYGTLAEEMRYKTIGHLIRLKHQLFERKYAKRALTLINEPHPLHLLPTIDILISKLGHREYGIEWKVPPAERKKFWMVLKSYVGWWRKDAGVTEKNIMNAEGWVAWDETLTLTSRTEQCFGIEIVKTVQQRTYRKVFEGDEWQKPKPLFIQQTHQILGPEPKDDPYIRSEGTDGESSDSDVSSQYHFLKQFEDGMSDTSVEEEPDAKVGWFNNDGHCDPNKLGACKTWAEWNGTPGQTFEDYNAYSYAYHKIDSLHDNGHLGDTGAIKRKMKLFRMVERSIQRRVDERKKFAELMAPGATAITPENPEEKIHIPEPLFVEAARSAIEEVARDQGAFVPPKQPQRYVPRPFTWEEANAEWEKLRKARRPMPYHPQGAGVALWDNLFPHTVDKRIDPVPFSNPLFYPDFPYPKGDCMLVALSQLMGIPPGKLLLAASKAMEKKDTEGEMLGAGVLDVLGYHFSCSFELYRKKELLARHGLKEGPVFKMEWTTDPLHFTPLGVSSRSILIRNPRPAATAPAGLREFIDELSACAAVSWADWKPSPTRAGQFVRAMIEKTTGTLAASEFNTDTLKGWENMCDGLKNDVSEKYMAFVAGSPGCRKSSPIQAICRKKKYQKDNIFSVAMATNTLAIDWRDKLGVRDKDPVTGRPTPGRYISTYERCLADGNWGWVMIFDEDKYPKGYPDLVAALFPWVSHFIFLCDPYQTEWHEPNPTCHLNSPEILGNANFLFPLTSQYIFGTWRLPKNIANFFRLPTWNSGVGSFHFSETHLHQWEDLMPFLGHRYDPAGLQELWKRRMNFVSSHAAKSWMEQLNEGDTITFAGTQGLSVELAIIEVDIRVLRWADARMIFTAMTRSSELIFICTYQNDGMTQMLIHEHPIFSQLLKYRENYRPGNVVNINSDWNVDMFSVYKPLPPNTKVLLAGHPEKMKNREFVSKLVNPDWFVEWIDPDRARGAARLDPESELYRDEPDFKKFILTMQWERPREVAISEALPTAVKVPTHLPQENEQALIEENDSQLLERYERELSYKNIFSVQVPDIPIPYWDSGVRRAKWMRQRRESPKLSRLNRKQKDLVIARELREGAADDVTHFKPHALNWGLDQRSDDKPSFGAGVAQRIRRKTYIENRQEVREGVGYGLAMFEALSQYMNWSEKIAWDPLLYEDAEILFQMRRADRSEALKKMSLNRASPDYVDFLTAKTQWKLKSREAKPASPLQTILVRSDEVLFRDGPLGIYLLEMIQRNCPAYCYLHAQRTFEQMADWISQQPDPGLYEMCDIEGFDSSIRGADLTLERKIMEFFNVREDHIRAYEEDKMDFHTSTIHFGIMRFSGEIFTWLFNTLHTLARECLKYGHKPGDPIAVSGDDILKWVTRPESFSWRRWSLSDPSVEKRYRDSRGEFCSFLVSKGLIFKDPVILYRRLKGQIERGRVDEVALGYFEMFAVQYRLADRLYDLMTPEEMAYCAAINRIMFNWKKVTGSTIALPWWKVHVDFTDNSGGSRDEAIDQLEKQFESGYSLDEILNGDIVQTSLPGVSFAHIWQMDSIDY